MEQRAEAERTAQRGQGGALRQLEVAGETLDFVDPALVAAAGFEGGDLAEWWTAVGW